MEFGRFAEENRARRGEGKPETFDFLGFTFYCSKSTKGKFLVKVKSSRKKVTSKLKKLNVWLKENRHLPIDLLVDKLSRSLRGYYQYYAVTCNVRNVDIFRFQAVRLLYKWLNRRSQKKSYNWAQFNDLLKSFPLPLPKCCFNVYEFRAFS